MRTKLLFSLTVLGVFVLPLSGRAATFRGPALGNADTALVIDAGEVLTDDVYAFGKTVRISGDVVGDVYVVGGEVVIDGTVHGDVVVLAGTVHVPGVITESLRAIAGDVDVRGIVGKDVVCAGGTLTLDTNATVSGDVAAAAGTMRLLGTVSGNVIARGDVALLNGVVVGYADAHTARVTLGGDARIGGNLSTETVAPLVRDPDASVGGRITNTVRPVRRQHPVSGALAGVRKALTLCVAALLLVTFFYKKSVAVVHDFQGPVGQNALWGILGLLLSLPACIALGITIIGIPFALILAFFVPVLLFVATANGALFLGSLVRRRFVKTSGLVWHDAWIGALVFSVVALIPVLGPLVTAAFVVYAFGVTLRMELRVGEMIRQADFHPHP